MQVEVTIVSGKNLKNVNWRHGDLKPYAVLWIDSGPKCTTKVDAEHDEDPIWDEKLSITLPPTSRPDTAILYIDIVHANAPPGTKPLVGSGQVLLRDVLNEARSSGKVPRSLKLKRPSGRPHGKLEIKIGVKDQMDSRQAGPYGQPAYYGYGAPPPQQPGYHYPYNAPAAPPAGYPTTYAYGAPPPVQAYGGYTAAAPVKDKKDKKDKHKHDMATGLAVGATAGLLGGLAIAEGVNALSNNNNNQAPTVVENVTYINETNVYENTNVYESTDVYESNDVYYSSTDVVDSGDVYDDGGW